MSLGFLHLTKLPAQEDFIELCRRYICNTFISQNELFEGNIWEQNAKKHFTFVVPCIADLY